MKLPVHRVESNVGATRDRYPYFSDFAAGHSIWWEWKSTLSEWTTVSTCDSASAAAVSPPPQRLARLAVPAIAHRSIDREAVSATFRFASATRGATYRCRLDAKPFRACASPLKITGVKPGKHRLEVEAALPGRVSSKPAVAHFSVPAPQRRPHRAG